MHHPHKTQRTPAGETCLHATAKYIFSNKNNSFVGERAGAKLVLQDLGFKYPRLVKILADQGFKGREFVDMVQKTFSWILEIVAGVAGIGGFQVQPTRWVVEGTFGWRAFQRRLIKDYEVLTRNSISFTNWAMIRLIIRKI